MITRTTIFGVLLGLCVCVAMLAWRMPDKFTQIKLGMSSDQVEAILGRPATIDQSETADQTISGEVDHYPVSNGDNRVIFVNHTVFKIESVYRAIK